MYTYRATVTRVVDGDTVDMKVDLGFRAFMALRFRLYGIDTPERGKPGWSEATEHLKVLLQDGNVVIDTHKDSDSFGRWLCVITKDGVNVNQQMINDGHAVKYVKK